MRTAGFLLLLVTIGCELEGPEDKRRDGETFAEAEARHAAERAAAEKRSRRVETAEVLPDLAPGETALEARREGDTVVVSYRGWLACDGNYALRQAGAPGAALRLTIVDRNTATQRASCSGPVALSARIASAPRTATSVRVDQGRGYGELTAVIGVGR